MRNNHPKSEMPAMKERAAEAKDKNGRQQPQIERSDRQITAHLNCLGLRATQPWK